MIHRFVELLPAKLEADTLYVSIEYKTVAHLCCCGCGKEVVTPITPNDWSLTYNGRDISLSPSIGNWDFKCRSHYWIKNDNVIWAENWTEKQIENTKKLDATRKHKYYENKPAREETEEKGSLKKAGFFSKFFKRLLRFDLANRKDIQ